MQYLVSHFLKAGTLELTFQKAGREPVQTRVPDHLPAGRMIGKPLYVLVDQGAASAVDGVDMLRVGVKPNALELWWKGEPTPRLLNRN
ncbi:hypothetical protein [Vitiosangium sp. GDMCC 1.1324]|uniref:hypothetical protein n=1 Tax=Vitiosangium sp. (strain GDMCC 1.1324) TaxID=2138576 RepID=UPI000D33E99D|nr:hypothetical protein [Vitiosangium sp. GDMCC 1.1324]PTL75088.1 hypothetical protein DAT35_56580 [Vitiosangium sp. GDMCC 1.1324]